MNTDRLTTLLLAGALCSFAFVPAFARENQQPAETLASESAEISAQPNADEIELRESLKKVRDKASADSSATKIRDLMIALVPKINAPLLTIADKPLSPEMLAIQKSWEAIAETHNWFDSVALENAYREAVFYFSARNLPLAREYFPVPAKPFKADFSELPPFTGKDDAAAWQTMKPILEQTRKFRDFWLAVRDRESADAAAEHVAELYREMTESAVAHRKSIPALKKMEVSEALREYILFVRQTLKHEARLRQAVVFDCEKYFGSVMLLSATDEAVLNAQNYIGKHGN